MDKKSQNLPLPRKRQRNLQTGFRVILFKCKQMMLNHFRVVSFVAVVFLILSPSTIKSNPLSENDHPHNDAVDSGMCDNYIKINGSTNVNHFHFVQVFKTRDKIIENPGNVNRKEVTLKIPVHDFETSNPMMYRDFLEFIQASEYPNIDITIFFSTNRLPAGQSNTIAPKIKIGLAGESRMYELLGQLKECRDNYLHVKGKIEIDLEDFGLKPPSKFMGMIKVDNKVFINFGLTLNN